MKMGVILPTTKLYGGVKRFLELGNIFIRRGHSFMVFSPEGGRPAWFDYRGDVDLIGNINTHSLDVLFITEMEFLNILLSSQAKRKVFYCVSQSQAEKLKPVVRNRSIMILVNSTGLFDYIRKEYKVTPIKAIGGVDCALFRPRTTKTKMDDTTILAYGRLHRRGKGTHLIVRACERLYRKGHKVRLILFDTPVDERARKLALDFRCKVPFEFITDHPVKENYSIFQKADIFVGAERKAGWSNTCAEAMASKVAVIATRAGTGDFLVHDVTGLRVYRNSLSLYRALRRLIEDPGLRARLAQAGYERIQRFTWDDLADRILGLFEGYDAAAATGALWPSTARFIQKSKVRNTGFLQILRKRKSNLLQNGVYVFAYHSIVDPACCAEWELAYHHVAINKDAFAAQIGMLINEAVPVRLSQIPDILKNGSADKPYFSITFDDGYSNVRRNAFDVLNVNHICPTVFVNGAFAGREQIYYRVLAAMLVASGGTKYLRKCLKREMGTGIPVTSDVLRYMKRRYQYRITEKAVLDAWKMSGRDVLSEKVHMDWQDLQWLQSKGWEIGNHTFTHPVLSQLTYREQKSEIENNITAITKAGLKYIKWLAYPNGSARHVNSDTRRWLMENTEWHGIFANGGVNLSSTRTEWLRIGVMKNGLDDFRQEIDIANRKMDAVRASS